ncbi:hypothetical protein BJ912DRAFT_1054636 [Pholiota molesta]|nr:hypothetical protein BJ912DRAFT_1054636 [Pholiota molesta]
MESLNLNTLASSLPSQQNAEKELLNDFKAAALSITTLYRSSRKTSKRAYNAGYAAACQDLLAFVQQGVSAGDVGPGGPSHAVEGGGMTIGRVMDWTEARVEAIRAREEEEEEDEEREKGGERAAPRPPTGGPAVAKAEERKTGAAAASSSRTKDNTSSLPTPHSPITNSSMHPPSLPPSPSPPPQATLSRSTSRPNKVRPAPTKDSFHPTVQPTHFTPSPFLSEAYEPPVPEPPLVIGAGAKRRHAVMMMLDHSAPLGGPSTAGAPPGGNGGAANGGGTAGSGLSKRRTRSARGVHQLQPHNSNISVVQMSPEDMDIEEDGRERKRVARR